MCSIILNINYNLCKMSLVPASLCNFCNSNDEYLWHFFVQCIFVSKFRDKIVNQSSTYTLDSSIWNSSFRAIKGCTSFFFDTIILIGKQTIYESKQNLLKPKFNVFSFKKNETSDKRAKQISFTRNGTIQIFNQHSITFAGTPRNFFKHIQINELNATNVSSVMQYSVNVSIVNSIVIVGFHCKQLVVSNVS